ncbi:MAG: hypothetical protein P0119_08300 [Nitrospira sp.]|nr:hypothetical protein [Nitrospira sp.]
MRIVLQANAATILTQGRTASFGRLLLFLFGVVALVTGCAHYPVNAKLEKYQPARITMGQALNAPTRADDLLMVVSSVLTFSDSCGTSEGACRD